MILPVQETWPGLVKSWNLDMDLEEKVEEELCNDDTGAETKV